jgi:hypothetical protein
MREHLPSLLTRASALIPQIGHFFRHFLHYGVGLLSIRSWSWTSPHGSRGKGLKTIRSRPRNASGASTQAEQNFPKRGDGRPGAWGGSGFSTETADRLERKNVIISIHIPKTGGTTFVEVLRKCAEEVLYLDYGSEGPATALFRRGKPITASFESILTDLDSLSGRSVIHGHFSVQKYGGRFPNALYVTWLRDPVERVVSHYFYWQRSYLPGDALWEQVVMQKMTLEQFARLDFARDVYFRWFSPLGVERFDFVGIMEEYDRSLELFRRLFCPEIQFDTALHNCNPNRRGNFYDVGPELRRKILELNQRDAYIYLDGVRRFRNLCAQVGLTCWLLVLQFGCGETDHCDYLIQFFA